MHKTHPNLSDTHRSLLGGRDPKSEAYTYIMGAFEGVKYVHKTDSYLLNGHEFDYAFCGHREGRIFYKLIDKEFGCAVSYSVGDDWSMFIQVRDFLVNKKFEEEYGGHLSRIQTLACLAWFCVAVAVVIVCGYFLIIG